MNVITILVVSVAVVAALTVLNLLVCFAVIRRLRAVEEAQPGGAADAMPAPGTVVSALAVTTTDGVAVGPEELAGEEAFVGVLSVGCPACETFAGEVGRGARSLPDGAVLLVAVSSEADARPIVDKLRTHASVAVVADDGPELAAFGGIDAFPTFMRLEHGVVVAADFRADRVLRTFSPRLAGARP